MPWKYSDYETPDDPDAAFNQVLHRLNQIGGAHWGSIKVEASDVSVNFPLAGRRLAHCPRAVVIWNEGDTPPEPASLYALGSTWSKHTWITDHDYGDLYRQLVAALNAHKIGEQTLSPASVWDARICMTNMHHGFATLTLFWRS